jgi:N-acetylglucosamine transport system permease protein
MAVKKDYDINKIRRTKAEKAVFIAAFVLFALYTLTIFYALFWAVSASLKEYHDFWGNMVGLPEKIHFQNYINAFIMLEYNETNLFGMLYNSLWYTLGSSILSILMVSTTGYVFAKYSFPLKEFVFGVVIFTMLIPLMGNLPALYKFIYTIGINDSPLYLITALGGFGANFLIMYSVFKGISWSYAESSFIDGGGHFITYVKVMFPLARGPIFALLIMAIIGGWNEYLMPILFLDKMPTIAVGLYSYKITTLYASDDPVYFAGIILSLVPVLTLFAIFSNKIMNNIVIGGLNG